MLVIKGSDKNERESLSLLSVIRQIDGQ